MYEKGCTVQFFSAFLYLTMFTVKCWGGKERRAEVPVRGHVLLRLSRWEVGRACSPVSGAGGHRELVAGPGIALM